MQVHEFNSDVFGVIGEGQVMAPTIPVSAKSLCEAKRPIFYRDRVIENIYLHMPRSLRCKKDSAFPTKMLSSIVHGLARKIEVWREDL